MFNNCSTVNEIITVIFEYALEVKTERVLDGEELHGYYLSLKSIPNNQVRTLPQLKRLFYNAKSKCKMLYGETNGCDGENTWAEVLSYVYEGLDMVFSGKANDKVSRLLQCYNINDVHKLLNNEVAVKELCSYVITFVHRKMQTLMKSKGNPDFSYDTTNNEYHKINYIYLDNDEENYDIAVDVTDEHMGELTEYIMTHYFDYLTNKQQLYCKCLMEFGKRKDGSIQDLNNNVLYTKQESYGYRKNISNKLMKLLKKDKNVSVGTRIRLE